MDRLKTLNVLFLEDNEEFAKNTIEFLEIYFNKVIHSNNIKDALAMYDEFRTDIIISDIKVTDGNGLNFVSAIRKINKEIPIVVLSAHKDEDFLFKAIPLNISSYEIKPLSYEKFLALLKKLSNIFSSLDTTFEYKNLKYSFESKELFIDNKNIPLTKTERLFMELLIRNKNRVITNDMIQRDVWENKLMGESAIKNLLFRLRKKSKVEFITLVPGVGYKLF